MMADRYITSFGVCSFPNFIAALTFLWIDPTSLNLSASRTFRVLDNGGETGFVTILNSISSWSISSCSEGLLQLSELIFFFPHSRLLGRPFYTNLARSLWDSGVLSWSSRPVHHWCTGSAAIQSLLTTTSPRFPTRPPSKCLSTLLLCSWKCFHLLRHHRS